MGKDSLLKSTTAKKSKGKTTKAAAKKDTPKKPVTDKIKPGKVNKDPDMASENLIFKKFDALRPPVSQSVTAAPDTPKATQVQPAVSLMDDSLRQLLMRKYSMAEIQSVASQKDVPSGSVDESPEEPALAPPSNNTFQAAQDTQTQNIDNSCSANNSAAIKPDPVIRSLMYGVAALIAVVILIVVASYRNSARYYLVAGDNAVEIWQGQFSPTGKHFFGVLHNYQLAEPAKSHYSKQDIFPVIFNYYLEKADALLETQNPPDFRSITEYLTDAKAYALNGKMAAAISSRLNTIERMTLLYKADVAIAQGTKASLDAAANYISRARATTTDAVQLQILDDKLAEIDVLRNALPAVDAKSEPKAESGSKETTDTEPSSSSSGGGAVE